jgi:DNA-binding transcriptional ArsR family regulator
MLNHLTVDRLFHALADPNRRAIVERLSRSPAPVSALAEPLHISVPAVLQHLQVLEASGLVRSEKAGRVRTCRLEPKALAAAEEWIRHRNREWEQRQQGAFFEDGTAAAVEQRRGTGELLDSLTAELERPDRGGR